MKHGNAILSLLLAAALTLWLCVDGVHAQVPPAPPTISLGWTANSEADLAGYKLHRGTTSRVYDKTVTLGKVTTYADTLPVLTVDKTYFYALTAYDLAGNESGKSNEVSKLVPGTPVAQKPGTPVLTSISRTTTSLTVAYAPVPNGIGGIAVVEIRYAKTPIQWGAATVAVCQASPCTITGLLPDTSYDVQAVARFGTLNVNAVFSLLSAVSTIKTLPLDVPPTPPAGLTILSATASEVIIVAKATDCSQVLTSTTGSTTSMLKRTVSCIK